MQRLSALTLILLGCTSAQALSAASPEEAARLTAVLQSYLSAEPGVVTVTPSGEGYDTKIDLAPLLAKVKEPGFSAQVSPIEMKLTGQGGGKWQVDQNQPLVFQMKVDGKADMKGSIGAVKSSGVFDEALGTFATQSSDMTEFAFEQTITEQGKTTKVSYTLAAVHHESSMFASGGGVDGTSKYTMTGLRETIAVPGRSDAGMPPMEFAVEVPSAVLDAKVKGLKPHALNGLAAWFVAHPAADLIKADQAALKDKLRDALPLFQSVGATYSFSDMSVNTMMGRFGVAKLDVVVDANGIVEDGRVREKFTFSGLTLPDGIVPPWAATLVPSTFTIDFNAADFNLAAPAKLIIDNFDLNQDPPLKPEMEQQLLQALLPKGTVTVGLGPSEVIASIFDLKAEGSMVAGPMAMPAGQALVKLKGLDEIMAAIQAAPPEMGMGQMAPMIIVAKGMGKQEADGYLSWKIESTPQGSVTINGVDPMKMGGQ